MRWCFGSAEATDARGKSAHERPLDEKDATKRSPRLADPSQGHVGWRQPCAQHHVVTPYTEERQEIAVETGVMTSVEAALLATQAQAETLVLMHVGGATKAGYARREAAQFHRRVYVPYDGDHFVVPLRDVGPVERTTAVKSHASGTRG